MLCLQMAYTQVNDPQQAHYADADNPASVAAGQGVYRSQCARCHGRNLQGQALWQLDDAHRHQRAPAHDASGHTWQHSDEDLYAMVRDGHFPGVARDPTSTMPAYAHVLSDEAMRDVLAFIKSRWGIGLRATQSTLNPAGRGMPAGAELTDWTLPPTCSSTQQTWRMQPR